VNLSKLALGKAKEVISKEFGEEYSKTRQYTNKNKGAQEAHEAIRPSDFGVFSVNKSNDENRLYDLIWKRAIASQMAPAKLERTTIKIGAKNLSDAFVTKGEVIKFDGFLKVYLATSNDDEEDQ